jgi:diadenosine tetraphosphate (Ap4A) HIT family hydrolase
MLSYPTKEITNGDVIAFFNAKENSPSKLVVVPYEVLSKYTEAPAMGSFVLLSFKVPLNV